MIIDPGGDAAEILQMIETAGVGLSGILLTHGHSDHIGAAGELKDATGALIYGSGEAAAVLAAPRDHVLFPGMPDFPASSLDHVIDYDENLSLGGTAVRAILTPGHTAGSITYFVMGGLFCGDLLFRGSIGRTDLSGGSLEQLMSSVRKLVLTYPPDTIVYPGHGSSTTLSREQESNPFLMDLGW